MVFVNLKHGGINFLTVFTKEGKYKYKVTKQLMKWKDGEISLVERVVNVETGEIISEKESDVLIYMKIGKLYYYVKCERLEKEDNNEELEIEG